MRRILSLLTFTLFSLTLSAQSSISANKIIAQLNDGADIALTGVTITGDLDFTRLNDREETQKGGRGNQQQWKYHVRNSLSFVDCTFEGDVWGFRIEGEEKSGKWTKNGPAHMADFHKDVLFKNCTFEEDVNFKYSGFLENADFPNAEFEEYAGFKYTKFNEDADFSGSKFDGDANFKYTDFDEHANMSGTVFNDYADFKYTKFPRGADFSEADFQDDAVFKYTEFRGGVDMGSTSFRRDADFKYTKFSSPSNFKGTDFGSNSDFKYAQLDGREFKGSR